MREALLPQGVGLECIVLIDRRLAARYRFRDSPRAESKPFIEQPTAKASIYKSDDLSRGIGKKR